MSEPETPHSSDERLRPTERLKRSSEYKLIFGRGRCFRSKCLRIHYRRTDRELSRLGLVVSRRHGKAVQRKNLKRLLREAFRRNKRGLPFPMDVVLVPQGPPQPLAEYVAAFRTFSSWADRPAPPRSDSRSADREGAKPGEAER